MTALRFQEWSLRTKTLVFLLVASALPVCVGAAIELKSAHALIDENARQDLQVSVDQLAFECDSFHRANAGIASRLAGLPVIVAFCESAPAARDAHRKTAQRSLEVFQGSDPSFRGVAILDTTGEVILGTEPPLVGRNYAFRGYFKKAVAGATVLSDIYLAVPEVGSVPSISYAAPVKDASGKVVAVAVLFIRAQAFWEIVRKGNDLTGGGSFTVIYDQHGIRIAHSFKSDEIFHPGGPIDPATVEALVTERRFGDRTRQLLERPVPNPEEFRRVGGARDDAVFRAFSPANGQWNLVVSRRLETAPWTVFYLAPEASLFAPATQIVRETLLASALVVVLALAAGVVVSGSTVRAIQSLAGAVDAMRRGDLATRVDVRAGAELGALGHGFNAMAGALSDERATLERRVRERTEALEKTTSALEEKTAALVRRQAREVAHGRALAALAGDGKLDQVIESALREVAGLAGAAVIACYRTKGEGTLEPIGGLALPSVPGPLPAAGSAAEALSTLTTVVVDPVPPDAELRFDAALAGGRPRAIAIVPLPAGKRAVGVLVVGGLASFGAESLGLLADLAGPLGLTVQRHELHARTERLAQELASTNEELRAQSDELRAQSDDLRAQQEELDRFFSLALDLLCVAGYDGKFKRLNPAWTSTLGYTMDELLASPFIDFVHEGDRPSTIAEFQKILGGATSISFENRYRCKDGSYRRLLWSAAPTPDRQLVFAAARDVTERHGIEEKLRGQAEELRAQQEELALNNAELERASRHKNEFLGNMSHELRTPLNAVIGFSDLLLEEARPSLSPKHAGYVEDILASGRHLLAIINDILDLAKIEAGHVALEIQPIEPGAAIADAAALVEPAARKKAITIRTIARASRPAAADRGKLRQILLNLLSNAVKFSPEGTPIEIGVEDVADSTRFWVRDEGPGIEKEVLDRLFQPFVQGESPLVKKHQGTGLGLAISKRLVEQHHGKIGATSRVGAGTTFEFTLPSSIVARAPESPPPPVADADRDRPSSATRVEADERRPLALVVEDDAASVDLVRAWLVDAGYGVSATGSAVEAIRLARSLSPRVIVLDLMLRDGDGFQVMDELARDETTRAVPIVVASFLEGKVGGMAARPVDSFVKPLDRRVFLERLKRIVAPGPGEGRGPLVLSIDDDPHVGDLLRPTLERAGYRLLTAHAGAEGLELARREHPDVIIVDLQLPDRTGFEIVDSLARGEKTRAIPVIVLTALDLTETQRQRLKRHVRGIAEKGDLTKDALLAAIARATGESRDPAPSGPGPAKAVLVVDDHDLNRELVRTLLERKGHRVLTAPDGQSAIEIARRDPPALIFMDLAMPGKDGFATARELKAEPRTSAIPIVALTAMAMAKDEQRVREAGFDGYLTKPIDRAALEKVVTAFLGPGDVGSESSA